MLAPLDNGTIFKTAFTDPTVFTQFVKDIVGIDIEVNKIETEKSFEPKVGAIDFSYDVFAESVDHRVIVEMQRVDYDYNFDRFLHYHMMAVAQLQQSAKDYKLDTEVYTIVVLTAPYKVDPANPMPLQDEVLISSVDPRNLEDKVVPIYGHKLIFLNHHYKNDNTPANYRDWLDLFYESTHNPENFNVNLNNRGIKKAVELIEYDNLTPRAVHLMKIDVQRKVVRKMKEDDARKEGEKKGLKEGEKKGLKEGAKKKAVEMAKKSIEEGLSIELIVKLTGLSKEEIKKL